jgi:trimeric autotransporter adhesin
MLSNDVARVFVFSLFYNLQITLIYSFPNGSYLKSLSFQPQFNDGKDTMENTGNSETISSTTSQGSSYFGGFGQPPAPVLNNDQKVVDPYVAAYAAFQQQQKELSEAKQSVQDQASAISEPETKADSYSLSGSQSDSTTSTSIQENSVKPMGISSYLNSLSIPDTTSSTSSEQSSSGDSVNDTSEFILDVFANETIEGNSIISLQAIENSASFTILSVASDTKSSDFEAELKTEIDENQQSSLNSNPFVISTSSATYDRDKIDEATEKRESNEPRSRSMWNVGSYLERLAQSPIEDDASTLSSSMVNDAASQVDANLENVSRKDFPAIDNTQNSKLVSSKSQEIEEIVSKTLNAEFKTSRPLIPIHAIKVEDNLDMSKLGDKPFFTSFSPKPPIRNIKKQPSFSLDSKQSRVSRIFNRIRVGAG